MRLYQKLYYTSSGSNITKLKTGSHISFIHTIFFKENPNKIISDSQFHFSRDSLMIQGTWYIHFDISLILNKGSSNGNGLSRGSRPPLRFQTNLVRVFGELRVKNKQDKRVEY